MSKLAGRPVRKQQQNIVSRGVVAVDGLYNTGANGVVKHFTQTLLNNVSVHQYCHDLDQKMSIQYEALTCIYLVKGAPHYSE